MEVAKEVKPLAIFVAYNKFERYIYIFKLQERTVNNPSLQCWELDKNDNNIGQKRT